MGDGVSARIPNLPPIELLSLWSELDEALAGKNGFGGDTAELYAYRFGRENPRVSGVLRDLAHDVAVHEHGIEAAEKLFDLLKLFESLREARCFVGATHVGPGRRVGDWLAKEPFVHRAHVRVKPVGQRKAVRP